MSRASNRFQVLRALAGVTLLLGSASAEAEQHHRHADHAGRRLARFAAVSSLPVIQCVTFARQDAGIMIAGNARDWWRNAAGIYARGSQPETGSVLSFHGSERMPLGHVAVVSGVQDSRTIMIDQSHWNSRGVARDVVVKDVSDDNDWTAVRVELGRGDGFGSIYSTHGFIYPRPDPGPLIASEPNTLTRAVIIANVNSHPARGQHRSSITEVAEASATQPLDLTLRGLSGDAPNRAIR